MLIVAAVLLPVLALGAHVSAQGTETVCRAGLVVESGESCTYPETTIEFSVDSSGRGRFLFFASGRSIEIKDATINGVVYNFVAKSQRDGTWLIESAGDSVAPPPTATPTPTTTPTPTPPPTTTPEPTSDGVCRAGLVVRAGETCTYPGTMIEFSVDSSGRGQFLSFTSGQRIEIKDSTINGVVYNFVAKAQRDGTWLIETAGDSDTPTTPPTPTPTPTPSVGETTNGSDQVPGTPASQRYAYDGSAIVLSWDASAGADTYTVYYDDFFGSSCQLRSSGSPSFCEELATGLTGTTYTHTEPDTRRNYYWVVACNSSGCSEIDSANPAGLGGSAPEAPANQSYAYDGSSIGLTWDASTDADTYTVYYHDFFGSSCRISFGSPSFCDELATDLASTTYTHADLDASGNYYWVVACNSYGCSAIDSANAARLGGSPPQAPANQRYEHEGSTTVLSWDAAADATSYTVYYDDFFGSSCRISFGSPSFCDELATDLSGTSYTHTDPNASRNFYWVVACNSFGCSAIESGTPGLLIGTVPEIAAAAHAGSLETDEAASVEGRILARRLTSGRVEFGFQSEGEALVLPTRRFFPANATVDRWLVSSEVVSDGEVVGRITARLGADGRIEFGFNPVDGERVLPRARFFPTTATLNRWLRSTIIDVPLTRETASVPTSPQSERDALVALYNATDGGHWRNRANWVSDAPLGAWYGVTTDSNGHVTELDLSDNQLKGAIPADLAKLEQLEALYLSDNELSGAVPAELGGLSNLVRLLLADNELSGDIPPELGNLPDLELLLLGDNKLDGKIPSELGRLPSLNVLALQANELSGEIPPDVGDLTKLETLFLYENEFEGAIPAELGQLSNLQILALHDNQLSGTLPDTLGDLVNLVAAAVCELNPDLVCNLAELVADTVLIGVDAVFSTVAAVGGLLGDIGGVARDVGSAIVGVLGGWW